MPGDIPGKIKPVFIFERSELYILAGVHIFPFSRHGRKCISSCMRDRYIKS